MKTTTKTREQLGPVDTGPPQAWRHWVKFDDWPQAVCGYVFKGSGDPIAGARPCPDCARIRGSKP